MEQSTAAKADLESSLPEISAARPERVFTLAMVVSGVRCILAYVVLPFVAPLLGLAPGVGPALGIGISIVAIVANVASIRRFWMTHHRWRVAVTTIEIAVIGFLLVLIAIDVAELVG